MDDEHIECPTCLDGTVIELLRSTLLLLTTVLSTVQEGGRNDMR
jgi:hypothetical protein